MSCLAFAAFALNPPRRPQPTPRSPRAQTQLKTGIKSYYGSLITGAAAIAKFSTQPFVAPMLQARGGAARAAGRSGLPLFWPARHAAAPASSGACLPVPLASLKENRHCHTIMPTLLALQSSLNHHTIITQSSPNQAEPIGEFYSVMTLDARDGARLRRLADTVVLGGATSAWGGLTIWVRAPSARETYPSTRAPSFSRFLRRCKRNGISSWSWLLRANHFLDSTHTHPPPLIRLPTDYPNPPQTGVYEANPLLVTQVLTPVLRHSSADPEAPPEIVGGVGVLTSWMEARGPRGQRCRAEAPANHRIDQSLSSHRADHQPSNLIISLRCSSRSRSRTSTSTSSSTTETTRRARQTRSQNNERRLSV